MKKTAKAVRRVKPGTTRRRPAELRQLMLDAADRCFARDSYAEVSMETIAEEAGVAPSVMYRHFATKWELFSAAMLQPFVEFLDDYRATWRGQLGEPLDDRHLMATMVAEFYDRFRLHRKAMLGLMSIRGRDEGHGAVLGESLDAFFNEMLSITHREIERRIWVSRVELDLTIRLVLGMTASAALMDDMFLPSGRRRPSRRRIVNHIADLALYGLRLKSDGAARHAAVPTKRRNSTGSAIVKTRKKQEVK